MRQLPIRSRLTLAFSVAMAVVLSVVGMLAYHRLGIGFADDLDRELRQRAQDLINPVSRPDSSLAALAGSGFIERGESFAELVTPRGTVMQATSTLTGKPLLSPAEAAEALRGTVFFNRPEVPGLNEPARLLATPVTRAGHSAILVVGGTRENGLEALRRVRTELLVGLPLLLLVSSAGAYLLAGAAFRPVEQMRRRAAEMSGGASGQRLPLPPGNDEVARLGVTLNELLARVDAALEQERLFVANASHELRTPLALLKTELELARRRPRPVEGLTAAIDSAADEVERLIRLAENLLLLAGADDAGQRITPERVEITALLATVSARFQPVAAELRRDLTVQPAELRYVEADPQRLQQAMLNLVGNAFQHGAGTVTLIARKAHGSVEFHVTDEGAGFSAEMLSHGFERFTRTPSTGGTGLGLSIVAAVARAHGGSAGVSLRPAGGSDVWIRLPMCPQSGSDIETEGASAQQSSG